MADHHHHQHRPHRLSLPQRPPSFDSTTTSSSPRPPYPSYPSTTPTPTPSKHRLHSLSLPSKPSSSKSKSSLSFLLLLLFSLRSLYSLLPFLRSSPSFSLFPFCFLVSFLSFLLSLSFSLFSPSSKTHFRNLNQPIFSLSSISPSQHKLFISKALLLALVFPLRFQALHYCGTAAMILAELSGNVAARFVSEARKGNQSQIRNKGNELSGFFALLIGLFLLSVSWDRIDCFPFSRYGFSVIPAEKCVRIWPMLLPFLSGFMGSYERLSMNPSTIRQLGQKRIRLISLFYTTVLLFVPAVVSFIMFARDNDGVSIGNFGWPLANTVVFGVLLSENYGEDKLVYSKDFQREFVVTFACTVVLELFYFPELSIWGLSLCGLLLYFAVRKLDPFYSSYVELGLESSESLTTSIMKPIRHILSERKSRKIALFLLINAAYMVVEFVAGFMSNSLGLISDACHMLFDCAALAIGLYASYISRLPANNQFNYGRGRFEVLSGYVNAVFLVLVGALIVLESFERILDPQEISTNSLLTVSIGGLVVNVVGLIFFHEEHHHAHGGSGSCSHSHSHSHSHSSHSHQDHLHSHGHGDHEDHHECISVSHGCHEKTSSTHDDHHQHQHCDHDHSHDLNHDHVHHHDHSHHHEHHDDTQHQHHCHSSTSHNSVSTSNCSLGNSDSLLIKPLSDDKKETKKRQHRHIDHNMEGIFLHVLADTLGSVGVVISTLLIKYKGWLVADPACSIFISVLIVSSVISLLRNSAEILLLRVPRSHEQDIREAIHDVKKIKGVSGIRNFHVWSLTNTDIVGTLHFHVSEETDKASTKAQVAHIFNDVGIKDLMVQVECVK
ncbi:Cation efflux family protein [Euphorbia peplus]|nr:Cation efflux family protein [Euphorbia peplus]